MNYIKLKTKYLQNQALTLADAVIISLLESMAENYGSLFISKKKLSDLTGLSLRTVYRAVERLSDMGLVKIKADEIKPLKTGISKSGEKVAPDINVLEEFKKIFNP